MADSFDMTIITKGMFESAISDQMDLSEAAELLRTNANVRSASEIFSGYTDIPADDQSRLNSYITDRLCDAVPGAKRDAVSRKVRTWTGSKTVSISKQSVIQLGFALGLSLQQTDSLMKYACEEGFHWRDPEDIVYIFALKNGLSYAETCALHDDLAERGLFDNNYKADSTVLTEFVRDKVRKISDSKELEDYLKAAKSDLGRMHNTAYSLFTDFLKVLEQPDMNDMLPDAKKLAINDVMSVYFYNNFIPRVRRGKKSDPKEESKVLTALQQGIRHNWPEETMISKMVNREIDVTRKVLILLFLATDGGSSDYSDYYLEDETDDEIFRDMYARMNSMLSDCGFSGLDPRVPFDWMIIYCMAASDSFLIDERMRGFLAEIFPTDDQGE